MDAPKTPSPQRAALRHLACGLMIGVALATCLALFTPSAASAHIKNKNLRQRYLDSVAAWEGTMNSYEAQCTRWEGQLNQHLTAMEGLFPPKNEGEAEGLQALAAGALSLYLQESEWQNRITSEDPGAIRRWERKVRPCFTTAADERYLNKAADRLIEGLKDLMNRHSWFVESARLAGSTLVVEARAQFAQAAALPSPSREIDAAIRALKRLAN